MIRTVNVNEAPPKDAGFRVLVMRKWPRGVSKDSVDLWLKDLGGSPELMREYKKGKISVASFQARYMAETSEPGKRELVLDLQRRAMNGRDLILMCDGEEEAGSLREALRLILEAH